jgi:hypothetical protein
MRTAAVALLLALFAFAASESALARKMVPPGATTGGGGGGGGYRGGYRHHHHHSFVGFGFGWGWWGPPAYYPVPVAVPVEPVTYIEQGSAPAAQPAWWYYCDAANAYYPHVRTCPTGWQRVPPVVPPQ